MVLHLLRVAAFLVTTSVVFSIVVVAYLAT